MSSNSRGISSILIVGLTIALAVGLFGMWYLNKMRADSTYTSQNVEIDKPIGIDETDILTPTPEPNLEITEISSDPKNTEADLDRLEEQMSDLDSSMDDSFIDELSQ